MAEPQSIRAVIIENLHNVKPLSILRCRRCRRDNDAAWSQLRKWIEYFGVKYGRLTIAVPPQYTSSDCFNCGKRIKKSLSVRTHVCECGYCEDRDINAALNILKKATIGHIGSWSIDQNASGDSTSTSVGVAPA